MAASLNIKGANNQNFQKNEREKKNFNSVYEARKIKYDKNII